MATGNIEVTVTAGPVAMATALKKAALQLIAETIGLANMTHEDFGMLATCDSYAGYVCARAHDLNEAERPRYADNPAADEQQSWNFDPDAQPWEGPAQSAEDREADKAEVLSTAAPAGESPAPKGAPVETGSNGPMYEDVSGASEGAELVSTMPTPDTEDDPLPPGAPDYTQLETVDPAKLLREAVTKSVTVGKPEGKDI